MHTAKISAKYQLCVPKKIREQMHMKPGEVFILIVKGNCLELVPKRTIKDMRGILSGARTSNTRDKDDRI